MVAEDETGSQISEAPDTQCEGIFGPSLLAEIATFDPPQDAIKRPLPAEGKFLRLIFGSLPLDEFEAEGLSKLNVALQNRNFPPSNIFDDDRQKLRFLQGNKYIIDDCIEDMLRHLEWRKEFLPVPRAEVTNLMTKGFCYVHGRDKCLRPILIIRCKALIDVPSEDGMKVVLFWLEFAISNLLVDGKVEQWRVIIDLAGCSTYNLPVRTLKDVAMTLTKNYRGRLNELFFVNSTLVLWSIWQLVNVVLPETTRQKISILTSDYGSTLFKAVLPNQLEERFGGACKDVTDFSKAILPPGPFSREEEEEGGGEDEKESVE